MKLYVIRHDNGTSEVVRAPEYAKIHAAGGGKVYVIDAEEYVPEPAQKPERWMVVDNMNGRTIRRGRGLDTCSKLSADAVSFHTKEGAELLLSALEACGIENLRVTRIYKESE